MSNAMWNHNINSLNAEAKVNLFRDLYLAYRAEKLEAYDEFSESFLVDTFIMTARTAYGIDNVRHMHNGIAIALHLVEMRGGRINVMEVVA